MSDSEGAWRAWVEKLSRTEDARTRDAMLREVAAKGEGGLGDRLYGEVVALTRVDMVRTQRVAQALAALAALAKDPYTQALSHRANGHVLALTGEYEKAIQQHRTAIALFEQLGRETDTARAVMNLLQPLIYLGRYAEAFTAAEQARVLFAKQGDQLRLARLDSNVANILYRQDRFSDALELYERARQYLADHGDAQDVGIVLRNMAVCYISLNRFDGALKTYHQARDFCRRHNLQLLVAECDYNIAYLHFLRAQYTTAIAMYRGTRTLCEQLADRYHIALCDLDLSELYLELNLSEEGYELAMRAQRGFEELKMGYEAAKAVTFQAIAANQQGNAGLALRGFERARRMFAREKNDLWPALIRLYEALVLEEQGEYDKARRPVGQALRYFRNSPAVTKTALCHLLIARLDIKQRYMGVARRHVKSAFELLERAESPAADFQAHAVRGELEEVAGDLSDAAAAYEKAHTQLEALRSRLLGEELKIAFLKDKLEVYESLVWLALQKDGSKPEAAERAFYFIERAKSRSLADLISFNLNGLPARTKAGQELSERMEELRLRLTLAYRQVQREELGKTANAPAKIQELRRESREYASEMSDVAAQLGSSHDDFASLANAGTASLAEIQATLAPDATLLEYYVARGVIHACIVTRETVRVERLADAAKVREVFRLLQFQLSKFRLGPEYVKRFEASLREAAESHLRRLYADLIAPIRGMLVGAHLTIVPHGALHYLPFQALRNDAGSLADEFTISMAPSASVFALCAARPGSSAREALVFGIPDPRAPQIRDEAERVAEILPGARLYLGETATEEVLRQHAAESRYIHIATHGLFRQDNPMFSSIRLGNSELTLYDIYRLRLNSDLVTLSGCGTGLNVVVGGDELLGLVRGLLYAGTSAVLVTLWDVNDETTALFMKSFYGALSSGETKAAALRTAMQLVRAEHPHPYYWAPFVLIGKYQ